LKNEHFLGGKGGTPLRKLAFSRTMRVGRLRIFTARIE
jgi:hypothetical protein